MHPGGYARPYLPGCTSVSVRLQIRIYTAAGAYLHGCTSVSTPLRECICAVAGMYLPRM
ncbi:hypothetical protein NXX40_03465 [Parabacteroides distasonis]|nr:hypothetical protein [Parabacteroides distasonis]